MSLDHILLGILREPSAGYDIKRQFQDVFNHFWSADLAQIYRSLQRLEKHGLLESRMEPSDRGPDRKVYRRTAAGTRQLREWLAGGPVFGTEKFSYLAQVFFLPEADPDLRERFFVELREELRARLAVLEAIEAGWKQDCGRDFPDGIDDNGFYAYLTLDMGIRKTRALVEWADDSLLRVRARKERKDD